MRLVGPKLTKVWTSRRKWLGNVVPMLFWFLPTAGGVFWIFRTGRIFGPGLWSVIAGQVIGWLALNYFGLYENGRIRRDSMRNLIHRRPPAPGPVVFVGCASTKHHSILDAHEDVGFLSFGTNELEFIGDERRMRLLREQISQVRLRPSVHSIVGLGCWISIEAFINGMPVRLLVEPRERDTLWGNLMLSGWLKKVIDDWRFGIQPQAAHRYTHRIESAPSLDDPAPTPELGPGNSPEV
ncbi:MAG: hypothetical protein QOJ65_1453 [Fimbriimonadaceae bacterium]|jgi:hypothetical protein|nr:hypothetical protein [Fimbriimonadaceae bacterium]